jgi:hypothetical protein
VRSRRRRRRRIRIIRKRRRRIYLRNINVIAVLIFLDRGMCFEEHL